MSNDFWSTLSKKKKEELLKSGQTKASSSTSKSEELKSSDFWSVLSEENRQKLLSSGTTIDAPMRTFMSDDDIAPVKGGNKDSIFKSGGFSDGVDGVGDFFGDLGQTVLGTTADLGIGILKGAGRLVEGVADLGTYGVAGVADLFGADEFAEKTKKVAQYSATDEWTKGATDYVDQYSVLGNKADMVSEGIGQVATIIATGGIGAAGGLSSAGATALTTGLTFASGMGSGMNEAYESGASDGKAFAYGVTAGTVEAVSELIFGGLGKGVKALGVSKGLTSIDDVVAKKISNAAAKFITSEAGQKVVGNTLEYAVKSGAEGLEEVISGFGSAIAKDVYLMNGEDEKAFGEILKDEKLLEQFVVSSIVSGIAQGGDFIKSTQNGRDFVSGLSKNEQTVVDKVYEQRLAEKSKNKTLSNKDKNKLYDSIVEQMEKGYISTDTIEEVLGGDEYKTYKDNLDTTSKLKTELEDLSNIERGKLTRNQEKRIEELEAMNLNDTTKSDELRKKLNDKLSPMLNGSKLAESYRETERRKQAFTADLTQYTGKQREAIERAVKSGVLNNTNRSHELVDILSKIEADKGIAFDYTNNEKLKETGFAVEGKTVNGFVKDGGVTLNVQSQKAWQSTVGHEITHVLEGTESYGALREALYAYAESKGELESRKTALTELYNGMDADIDAELTADLVGDYLFSDKDFINHLTGNRTLFQKVYDEIKYLCKVATGKEKADIEKVKREFDRAWETLSTEGKAVSGIQYSVSPETDTDYMSAVERGDTETAQKIVDEAAKNAGYGIKAYHGTGYDFTVFDKSKQGDNYQDWGRLGKGFYFAPTSREAETWAELSKGGKNKVMPVYLRSENMLDSFEALPDNLKDTIPENWDSLTRRLAEKYAYNYIEYMQEFGYNVQQILTEKGYDGINGHTEFVVFDPEQVKSADTVTYDDKGNVIPLAERFDAANKDIRYSLSSMANTFFGDEKMTSVAFEESNYKETEGYKNYVDECINNMRQTRTDFDEAVARQEIEEQIDGIVRVALAAKKAGYDIYDDATKRSKTDSKNRLLFSSLEPNSDYFTSSDISTICDKRKNFAEIYDEIVKTEEAKGVPQGKRFFDNVDNYFALHKIMADKGLTQPCRQCYVESMRKNLAPMANAFLRLVNETDLNNKANDQLYQPSGKHKGELKSNNAELRKRVLEVFEEHPEYNMSVGDLTVETLTTEDGLAHLKIRAPLIYEAFNSFYGQSKPKMPKSATPFRFGELTALLTDEKGKIKKSLVEKINSTGGFRLQSYSDFQIQNYTDVLQVIFEAGTLGLSGHAYTKVPAFLEATEGTNLKRNISIFMYKDGNEWKLDKNDSFPYELEEIYKLVNDDKSGNTGIIAVSQNKDMSCWIMANDYVAYGIPFHKSGMKMGTVRDTDVKTDDGRIIKGYSGTIDHTKQQTEVWAKSNADHKALTKVKKGINIYAKEVGWDFENNGNLSKNELIEKNVKKYIDACERAGYLPKFRDYVMNNGAVLNDVLKYSKELGFMPQDATIADISFEYKGYTIPYGYYKFLGDFNMFTPDGKASPQETLSLNNYDFDKAEKFFADAEGLRRNEILQQFANGEERQKYRDSDLNAEDLTKIINQKRKEVAESIVAPVKASLSGEGEQFAPIGNYSTPLNETALEQDIAPVAEGVAKNATATNAPVAENVTTPETADEMLNIIEEEKASLAKKYANKKAELQKLVEDKATYFSNKAQALYNEVKGMKKGVKVSNELGYLLDNLDMSEENKADSYRQLRTALLNIKNYPTKALPQDSWIESIAREMINNSYENDVYELDDIDNQYKQEVAKLEEATPIDKKILVKLKDARLKIENNKKLRDESNADFDRRIAILEAEYEAKKNKTLETELANNIRLREESRTDFDTEIAHLKAEYEAKKNKNTKVANNILRRIERLQRFRDGTDADYEKKIANLKARVEKINSSPQHQIQIDRLKQRKADVDAKYEEKINSLNERIQKMQSPEYNRAMRRQAKMAEHAQFAANLLGNTATWVDKKLGLQYATNTERRNLRDIVRDENGNVDIERADAINDALNGQYNREEADRQRELAQVRKKYADLKITKAEDEYIQMLGELRYNPETELSPQTVNEYLEKHKDKIDEAKVDKAIELARQDYDDFIIRVNEVLREQGMREIPYRKGYFPHFVNPKQNFVQKLFNWKMQDNEIPTSIAGLTEEFKPVKSWQSFDKERTGKKTDYSFTKGFDMYSNGVLDWIYHLDTIQKRRAVENHIRFTHSDEGITKRIKEVYANEEYDANEAQAQIEQILSEANNPLNNFVQDFMTHTNILTNKKNSLDRTTEQLTNRKIYSVMQNVQNRTSANMVLANVRSALTNFISITQSWAQVSPLRSIQATKDTIANAIKDDGLINKSTFLTNRLREADSLYKTNWDVVLDKAGIMFEIVDNFSSQVIWRSKYNQNLDNGMSEAEAIANADQFAENVMAGRSKGNEPTLFNAKNPIVKAFTMFQLEVNNQYGYLFKDVPNDLKAETNHWKLNLAKGYTTAFIGAYVYNALLEQVAGSGAALDPIGIIEELLKDLGLFDDDEEEGLTKEGLTKAGLNLADNVIKEIPLVGNIAGGGRIPISSALPYADNGFFGGIEAFVNDVSEGNKSSIDKELQKPFYNLLMPVGGGQLKKTIEGLSMFNTDEEHPIAGSYTTSGNLRFPVEDTPLNRLQAGIFGQYASKNAREYFDNDYAPLKEKQIEEYMDVDLPIADYWKYREGLSGLKTNEEKANYINSLDIKDWQKNLLMNNILDRKEDVDMSNYDDFGGWEEFDYAQKNPDKYAFAKSVGGYSAYKTYSDELYGIKADKDSSGKSISGSRKEKVLNYINNLDADYETKIILWKSEYPSDDTYNMEIINYINNRTDLTYEERVSIFTELGFTVSNGSVYWD